MKISFVVLIGLLCLVASIESRRFFALDTFTDRHLTQLIYADEDPNVWYAIYTYGEDPSTIIRDPLLNVKNTTNAIGGQRDVVITHRGSQAGGIVNAENSNGAFSINFPLGFVGSVFVQYDGFDQVGNRSATLNAAYLNERPGMGASAGALANPDGQTVDFTVGGRAFGLTFVARADHPLDINLVATDYRGYQSIIYGRDEPRLQYVPITDGTANNQTFFIRFDNPNWDLLDPYNLPTEEPPPGALPFFWDRVACFEFNTALNDNNGNSTQPAIDAAIYPINVFGYEITGVVRLQCQCTGTASDVSNELFNLLPATGTTVLQSTRSAADGTFSFFGQQEGTYRVCIANTAQPRCTPATGDGCFTVTLANLVDPAPVQYVLNSVSTFVPPPAQTINCTDSTDVASLGSATFTPCGGNSVAVTNFTDSPTTGTCTRTFSRTFTTNGQSVTQVITIQDNAAPVVVTPAQNQARVCNDATTESFVAWRNRNAGSDFSDCTALTRSNNGTTSSGPGNCGTVVVAFTATDACGRSTSSIASYSVTDGQAPQFTPISRSVECDRINNSDFASFNNFLSTRGNSTVTDNCDANPTITNNFPVGTNPARGCGNATAVTFTARDACGNTNVQTATFTIEDAQGPTITRQATQNFAISCSDNVQTTYQAYLARNGDALATDTCSTDTQLVWNNNAPATLSLACNGALSIIFTVRDACGNAAASGTTGSVVLQDNTPPVISQNPQPLTVSCSSGNDNSQLQSWLANGGGLVANDACSNPVSFRNNFNASNVAGSCTNVPVIFSACDACGNCANVTSTYTISDTQAPVFNPAPSSRTVVCGSGTNVTNEFQNFLNTFGGATVSDNCASTSQITVTNSNGNAPISATCNTNRVVTFTARDVCGNSAPATATFSVTDNTPPTVVTPPTNPVVECNSAASTAFNTWRSTRGGFTAQDACGTVSYPNTVGPSTVANPTGLGVCSNSVTVTFVSTDGCGNFLNQTATFTVTDTVAPRITTQASNSTEECGQTGLQAWLNNNGGARAADDCTNARFTNDFTALDGGCTRSARVTFTATDDCGNFNTTTATYSVRDTAAPVINPRAQPRTVPCNDQTRSELLAWVADHGGARASDACQDDSLLTWTSSFADQTLSCGSLTLTFTVTDSCGNSAATTSTFTSQDTAGPSFTTPAQNLTVECDGAGNTGDFTNFVNNRAGAQAFDVCSLAALNYTVSAPTAGPTSCGSVNVIVTAADQCGNSARSTGRYTVQDSTAPIFVNLPTDSTVECDGSGNTAARSAWLSSNGGATASDNCAATAPIVSRQLSTDGTGCARATTYLFTASDSCGNSVNATARFIITDLTAPTFTTEPSDATYECDGRGNEQQIASYLANNGGARVRDACTTNVTLTNDFGAQRLITCTSAAVTFRACDQCGNCDSRSTTIVVEDSVGPTFTTFPQNYELPCDADLSEAVLGTAFAFDQCAGNLTVNMVEVSQQEPANGDCPGNIIITRTYSAMDACGGSVTRDQIITVLGQRGSGPCPPEGCECDGCCPPPAPSDCLPVDCEAVACSSAPCEAVQCSCSGAKEATHTTAARDLDELPQCKPVYIYVNDDDDDSAEVDAAQRTLVSNKPLNLL